MLRGLFFTMFTGLFILLSIAFPHLSLFLPTGIFLTLFVSLGWSLAYYMIMGLWLDSLYSGELIVVTLFLVFFGILLDLTRSNIFQRQLMYGMYAVIVVTVLMLMYTMNLALVSWLGLIILGVNVAVNIGWYFLCYSFWKKLSRPYV